LSLRPEISAKVSRGTHTAAACRRLHSYAELPIEATELALALGLAQGALAL
jgi:hypothetical protein